MAIPIEQGAGAPGLPVLKRAAIGESFVGALVHLDQRQIHRDGQPQTKPDGKPRMELVLTLMALESNMAVGIGDTLTVPQRGDLVRIIMKGGAFGQWIEVRNAFVAAHRPVEVGDLVQVSTTHAVRYESMGQHRALGNLGTQAELDEYYSTSPAYRNRTESLGFRGDLAIVPAPPSYASVVAECEAHYMKLTTEGIQAEAPAPAPVAAPPVAAPAPMPTPPPVHGAVAAPPPQAPAPVAAEPTPPAEPGGLASLFG